MLLVRADVSGAISTPPIASSTSAMCTMNGSCSGCGAYCTSSPASNGPRPNPPMLAMVATAAARVRQLSGAGFDDRGGGCAGEDARRHAREQPSHQQLSDAAGEQEDDRAGERKSGSDQQYWAPPDGIGPAAESQKRQ